MTTKTLTAPTRAPAPAPTLRRSNDRKIAVHPRVANAFGLPGGQTCPGKTDACFKDCYALAIERRYKAVPALLQANLSVLRAAAEETAGPPSSAADRMRPHLSAMLAAFAEECRKRSVPALFRWHWDGDVFDADYAEALAGAMREHPNVQGWIYTRSAFAIPTLLGAKNLTVYYSVDAFNVQEAAALRAGFGEPQPRGARLRFAFLGTTWEESTALAALLGERPGPKCPELTGALPLVDDNGQGACVTCGLCIEGRANVRFASNKAARKGKAGPGPVRR